MAASRLGRLVSLPFTWESVCTQGRSDMTYLTNSFRTVLCTSLSTMFARCRQTPIYFRRVTALRTGSPRVDISAQKPGVRDFSQYFQVPAGMAPHKPQRPPSTSFTVIQHSTLYTLWVAGNDVKATKYEVQLDYRPI